jgi:hypothetical protein
MKLVFKVFLAILLIFMFINSDAASEERFDYLFVVDCSGSMVGLPDSSGNAVVFPDVKRAINKFIDGIGNNSSVTILPFHRDIQGEFTIEIIDDESKSKAKEYVNNLVADGQVTWIYYSIRHALQKAEEMRGQDESKHVQMILLYTDGLDTGPEDLDLDDILEEFTMQRGENEFLSLKYYSIGVEPDPEDSGKIENTEGAEIIVVDVTTTEGIDVIQKYPVQMTTHLDFGNYRKKEEDTRTITPYFEFDVDALTDKEISMRAFFPELDSAGVTYEVSPRKFELKHLTEISLKTYNRETLLVLPPKSYEGQIIYKGSEELEIIPPFTNVQFSVEPEKVISVTTKDRKVLRKDFGEVIYDNEGLYESEWPLLIEYNEYAEEERIKVRLELREDSLNVATWGEGSILLSTDEGEKGSQVSISRSSEVNLIMTTHLGDLKPGSYNGSIVITKPEGVNIEGDGLEQDPDNAEEYVVGFSFVILTPPSPGWLKALLVTLALICIFIAIIILTNPNFYPGSALENNKGELVSLKKKTLKRWYSIRGYPPADFVMTELPPEVSFMVKPTGRKSKKLLLRPDKEVVLEQDDYIQSEGDESTNVKVYYKILGEEE